MALGGGGGGRMVTSQSESCIRESDAHADATVSVISSYYYLCFRYYITMIFYF